MGDGRAEGSPLKAPSEQNREEKPGGSVSTQKAQPQAGRWLCSGTAQGVHGTGCYSSFNSAVLEFIMEICLQGYIQGYPFLAVGEGWAFPVYQLVLG